MDSLLPPLEGAPFVVPIEDLLPVAAGNEGLGIPTEELRFPPTLDIRFL